MAIVVEAQALFDDMTWGDLRKIAAMGAHIPDDEKLMYVWEDDDPAQGVIGITVILSEDEAKQRINDLP